MTCSNVKLVGVAAMAKVLQRRSTNRIGQTLTCN